METMEQLLMEVITAAIATLTSTVIASTIIPIAVATAQVAGSYQLKSVAITSGIDHDRYSPRSGQLGWFDREQLPILSSENSYCMISPVTLRNFPSVRSC